MQAAGDDKEKIQRMRTCVGSLSKWASRYLWPHHSQSGRTARKSTCVKTGLRVGANLACVVCWHQHACQVVICMQAPVCDNSAQPTTRASVQGLVSMHPLEGDIYRGTHMGSRAQGAELNPCTQRRSGASGVHTPTPTYTWAALTWAPRRTPTHASKHPCKQAPACKQACKAAHLPSPPPRACPASCGARGVRVRQRSSPQWPQPEPHDCQTSLHPRPHPPLPVRKEIGNTGAHAYVSCFRRSRDGAATDALDINTRAKDCTHRDAIRHHFDLSLPLLLTSRTITTRTKHHTSTHTNQPHKTHETHLLQCLCLLLTDALPPHHIRVLCDVAAGVAGWYGVRVIMQDDPERVGGISVSHVSDTSQM